MAAPNYCTVNNGGPAGIAAVRPRLRQLTSVVMSDPDVQEYITEVQTEVDGTLAKRYAVPFPDLAAIPLPTPTLISVITANLACVYILDRTQSGDASAKQLALAERLEKRARELLAGLASGDIVLLNSDGSQYGTISSAIASIDSGRCADHGKLQRFDLINDPNRYRTRTTGVPSQFDATDDELDSWIGGDPWAQ